METFTPSGRQRILNYAIPDLNGLYAAYMPFVKNGGIFISNSRRYEIGDEVFLLLKLLDDPDTLPIAGKVIWITPPGAEGNRAVGVGIQLGDQDKGAARRRIETLLGDLLEQTRPTHTL